MGKGSVSKSVVRLTKPAIRGVTGVGATLMLLATLTGSAAQSPSAQPATGAAAPSSVSVGGITLRSVSVVLPESQRTFAGGSTAEAINKDCLICHSAGMVLTQPEMSLAQWKAEEEKMRSAYDAPIDPKDDDVITDYLAKLRLTNAAAAYQQIRSHQADPEHGRVIAEQGTVGGAPGCAGCHALNGSSDGSGAFPRIAGQSAYYLGKQMRAFASDLRTNAIMSPIAKALSASDIGDVAVYYAGLDPPFPPLPQPAPALVLDGERLATAGDSTKGISACENCHGARGADDSPAIPYLAGQYSHYVASELQMWRRGYRKNSSDIMLIIAGKLDDHEIESLAAYYQQLRAPAPVTVSK
jgi:cytochrome c553